MGVVFGVVYFEVIWLGSVQVGLARVLVRSILEGASKVAESPHLEPFFHFVHFWVSHLLRRISCFARDSCSERGAGNEAADLDGCDETTHLFRQIQRQHGWENMNFVQISPTSLSAVSGQLQDHQVYHPRQNKKN